jgi:hypothetical protein
MSVRTADEALRADSPLCALVFSSWRFCFLERDASMFRSSCSKAATSSSKATARIFAECRRAGGVLRIESRPDETLLDGVSGPCDAGTSWVAEAFELPKLVLEERESASVKTARLERGLAPLPKVLGRFTRRDPKATMMVCRRQSGSAAVARSCALWVCG